LFYLFSFAHITSWTDRIIHTSSFCITSRFSLHFWLLSLRRFRSFAYSLVFTTLVAFSVCMQFHVSLAVTPRFGYRFVSSHVYVRAPHGFCGYYAPPHHTRTRLRAVTRTFTFSFGLQSHTLFWLRVYSFVISFTTVYTPHLRSWMRFVRSLAWFTFHTRCVVYAFSFTATPYARTSRTFYAPRVLLFGLGSFIPFHPWLVLVTFHWFSFMVSSLVFVLCVPFHLHVYTMHVGLYRYARLFLPFLHYWFCSRFHAGCTITRTRLLRYVSSHPFCLRGCSSRFVHAHGYTHGSARYTLPFHVLHVYYVLCAFYGSGLQDCATFSVLLPLAVLTPLGLFMDFPTHGCSAFSGLLTLVTTLRTTHLLVGWLNSHRHVCHGSFAAHTYTVLPFTRRAPGSVLVAHAPPFTFSHVGSVLSLTPAVGSLLHLCVHSFYLVGSYFATRVHSPRRTCTRISHTAAHSGLRPHIFTRFTCYAVCVCAFVLTLAGLPHVHTVHAFGFVLYGFTSPPHALHTRCRHRSHAGTWTFSFGSHTGSTYTHRTVLLGSATVLLPRGLRMVVVAVLHYAYVSARLRYNTRLVWTLCLPRTPVAATFHLDARFATLCRWFATHLAFTRFTSPLFVRRDFAIFSLHYTVLVIVPFTATLRFYTVALYHGSTCTFGWLSRTRFVRSRHGLLGPRGLYAFCLVTTHNCHGSDNGGSCGLPRFRFLVLCKHTRAATHAVALPRAPQHHTGSWFALVHYVPLWTQPVRTLPWLRGWLVCCLITRFSRRTILYTYTACGLAHSRFCVTFLRFTLFGWFTRCAGCHRLVTLLHVPVHAAVFTFCRYTTHHSYARFASFTSLYFSYKRLLPVATVAWFLPSFTGWFGSGYANAFTPHRFYVGFRATLQFFSSFRCVWFGSARLPRVDLLIAPPHFSFHAPAFSRLWFAHVWFHHTRAYHGVYTFRSLVHAHTRIVLVAHAFLVCRPFGFTTLASHWLYRCRTTHHAGTSHVYIAAVTLTADFFTRGTGLPRINSTRTFTLLRTRRTHNSLPAFAYLDFIHFALSWTHMVCLHRSHATLHGYALHHTCTHIWLRLHTFTARCRSATPHLDCIYTPHTPGYGSRLPHVAALRIHVWLLRFCTWFTTSFFAHSFTRA